MNAQNQARGKGRGQQSVFKQRDRESKRLNTEYCPSGLMVSWAGKALEPAVRVSDPVGSALEPAGRVL